jgi:DNA-binding response OmpR family regulator
MLLIVDDEPAIRRLAMEAGETAGIPCRAADSGPSFKKVYLEKRPDIVVLDLSLPGTDGIELLRFLADEHCTSEILIVSGHQERVLAAAERLGALRGLRIAGVIGKPIRLATLVSEFRTLRDRINRSRP